ncbi:MAG: YebG family protein [Thermodesulfobacteriota bacterium]
MAVIVKYFIVRNGVELEQAFTDKREADAYDKMLDAADELETFIRHSGIEIDLNDRTIREIAVVLAKNGPEVTRILKNVKPLAPAKRSSDAPSAAPDTEKEKAPVEKSKRKSK